MGRFTILVGLPGSGKSYTAKMKALDLARSGRKILWITFLREERYSLRSFFIRQGVTADVLIPKYKICPYMAELAGMDARLYLAAGHILCQACRHRDKCPRKRHIREVIESNDVIIGSPADIALALIYDFDFIVVDEFDSLFPDMLVVEVPKKLYEAFRGLLAQFNEDLARELDKRSIDLGDRRAFPNTVYYTALRYLGYNTYFISATFNIDPYSEEADVFFWTNIIELEENNQIVVLPPPQRNDIFMTSVKKLYAMAPGHVKLYYYLGVARAVKQLYREHTVTVLARSKAEAKTIHHFLKKHGVPALTEGVNWLELGQWRSWRVRVLVIGGRFHRSLNMDSDYTIAFYQHPRPNFWDYYRIRYKYIARHCLECHNILIHRPHVQTLFRSIRDWRKPHKVILLDNSWTDSFYYYPHIWEYVRPRRRTFDPDLDKVEDVILTV